MPGESKNRMQCAEFDALLSDVLDGKLAGEQLETFNAHARTCAACGPLFADAKAGHQWLKGLPEVEVPVNLVHNILAATTGREVSIAPAAPARSWKDVLGGWLGPVFGPAFGSVWATARQPRFAMSFSMVFFSLSITMSLAGVNVKDIRSIDLRPSAIKHAYYTTSGKVVKYYENIRFVYEVESRVREFKRSVTPAEPGPAENKKPKSNDTSGQPEQKQERNYSQGEGQPVLAGLPGEPPVVTEPAHRRFS